jgi:LmbE family N-acetylglucosaminyl deacetylase
LARNPKLRLDWIVVGCNEQRLAEAKCAAAAWCGEADVTIHAWEFQDTLFPSQMASIKESIHALSKSIQPDIVFTHRREDLHQDHRTLAEITWNAFRDHLILEYEIPKYEGDLGNPNTFMPLSKDVAERKMDLLMHLFPSQQNKPWYGRETFRAMMILRGLECKSPSGYAEAFHARKVLLGTL